MLSNRRFNDTARLDCIRLSCFARDRSRSRDSTLFSSSARAADSTLNDTDTAVLDDFFVLNLTFAVALLVVSSCNRHPSVARALDYLIGLPKVGD